jgi:uncharacterized protein
VSPDSIVRSAPFALAGDGADGRTLEGHAAVFDTPTRVCDDGRREYIEMIARGAFTKTLRERTPVLMFEHGNHPLVGTLPIGRVEVIREDDRGLYVRARLLDNWLVDPVRDAISQRAVTGMSFRFRPVTNDTGPAGEVIRREVALVELGPVSMPAYEGTDVTVRSQALNILTALDDDTIRHAVAALARLTPTQRGEVLERTQHATRADPARVTALLDRLQAY